LLIQTRATLKVEDSPSLLMVCWTAI